MNHGIHYVSNCWTFVFGSHCILPGRCTEEVNAQMHDHCQSTCRLFIQCFFSIFSLDATLKGILLAVILSRFRHHPGYYTTIIFWSGLAHPSDLDLVTAHAIIPQLTSDPILNTHQISSWSPPTLLYHNWYQVSAPTLLYHNWYQVSDPVSHTHQMPRVA